ncbi:MAG: hypothetical protein ACO4CS_17760 [bacterium]
MENQAILDKLIQEYHLGEIQDDFSGFEYASKQLSEELGIDIDTAMDMLDEEIERRAQQEDMTDLFDFGDDDEIFLMR